MMSSSEHIAEQARQVDRRPTEPQKAAGNYRKGHVRLHGMEIAIENPCGSFREGKGPDGKVWRCRLPAHYGYFKGSEGADGDHVDVFIGPHHKSQLAYVIDQRDHRTDKYDEAKVMLGFVSPAQARRTYMEAFSDGKGADRIGALHEMTISQLKDWLKDGNTKRPYKRGDGGRVQPLPENKSSLEAQQKQLVEGNRHAQLFPAGKGELPLPKGMHRAKMDNGDVFHFNLRHTNIKKLKAASKAGKENEVLGLGPFSKHEVMARAMRGEHPVAVVERDAKGNEVRAAAGTHATAPTQAAHMAEGKSPGNTLAVEHPIHTLSKRRAAGGVAMADGGDPTSWGAKPVSTDPASTDDPASWGATPVQSGPDHGTGDAALRGATQGATFNFGDELRGLAEASGDVKPEDHSVDPLAMGAALVKGGYKYWTGDKDAGQRYDEAVQRQRDLNASASAHHPWVYGGSEVAGSLPAMSALPEAGAVARLAPGAGQLARMGANIIDAATTGASYGAISGAGEGADAGQRVENAGAGALGGAAAGVIAPTVGGALSYGYDRAVRPVVQTVRGWVHPEEEAARRVASALDRDQQLIASGQANGLSLPEWQAARARGEPVTLADLGAGHTQSLLRSAANTSPEGRALLEQVIEGRFLNQGERVAGDVRNLVAGGANANKTADQLVAEYDVGRAPLYRKAFSQPGAQAMWTPELEQMTQAPVVQNAIRMANITAKNEAAKLGFTPMRESPFSFDASGRLGLSTRPDGSQVTPNLQYWDAVKKNLDQMGADGSAWSRTLRDHLDQAVPDYAKARGFAANFFGERDALDAGRKLAGKRVDPQVIRQSMRKMDPGEQDLFREGYASDWADRVVNNISDTRDITKAMFNSPNERARAEAVFGPSGMRKMEARMSLETIMNGARNAMGNSTTARQLIEAGLAGGALGGYASGWDPRTMAASAATFAGARAAPAVGEKLGSHLATEVAAGAHRLIGKVDAKTASNVARLLTSDDPQQLQQGIRLAISNQRIAEGLKRVANRVALSSTAPASRESAIRAVPALQNAVGARADDQQQRP